jgi:plastocyanin
MTRLAIAALVVALLVPGHVLAEELTVTMAGMSYQPERIAASVGDAIRFVNDDDVDHNVFVPTAGHATDLGKQEPGSKTVLPLAKGGSFEVECVIHPDMLMVVEVQ